MFLVRETFAPVERVGLQRRIWPVLEGTSTLLSRSPTSHLYTIEASAATIGTMNTQRDAAEERRLIQVEASEVIRSSPETVWRHLTRVPEWPRWYPGLHGVHGDEPIIGVTVTWRSSGQLGRLLYRSDNRVTHYQALKSLEIQGDRRPWIREMSTRFELERSGPNSQIRVAIEACPSLGIVGRLVLTRILRTRLQAEAAAICERLGSYVERALPHH